MRYRCGSSNAEFLRLILSLYFSHIYMELCQEQPGEFVFSYVCVFFSIELAVWEGGGEKGRSMTPSKTNLDIQKNSGLYRNNEDDLVIVIAEFLQEKVYFC